MKKLIVASLLLLFAGSVCSAAVHADCKVEKKVEFNPVKEFSVEAFAFTAADADFDFFLAPAVTEIFTVTSKSIDNSFATVPKSFYLIESPGKPRYWQRENLNSTYLPDQRRQIYYLVAEKDE